MDFYTDVFECMSGPSLIRLLNVSPGILPLDIYSDAEILEHPLYYGEFTEYRNIASGSHTIRVFQSGKVSGALENRKITLSPDRVYTLAIGDIERTGLFIVPESETRPPYDKALIRVVHLSPIVVPIDIILPCGTTLFKNVKYEEITEYVAVNPEVNSLFVRKPCADTIIFRADDIILEPGGVYTIYTAGLLGFKPKFQLIMTQDGDPSQCY